MVLRICCQIVEIHRFRHQYLNQNRKKSFKTSALLFASYIRLLDSIPKRHVIFSEFPDLFISLCFQKDLESEQE